AVEILRGALANQGRIVRGRDYRVIRWASWNRPRPDEFIFTGQIIALGNLPFPDGAAQDALRSRLVYVHFVVDDDELIELMRSFPDGAAQDALRSRLVYVHFVVDDDELFRNLSRPMDLRAYFKALEVYAQWSLGRIRSDWHDLARTVLWEYLADGGLIVSREELDARNEEEDALLREILGQDGSIDEKLKLWQAATKGPRSRATFFRRKKLIEGENAQ